MFFKVFAGLASLSRASPTRCQPSASYISVKDLEELDYMVVKKPPRESELLSSSHPASAYTSPASYSFSHRCPYNFVEEKKISNQLPKTVITAKASRRKNRCQPVNYSIIVLKESEGCDDILGIKTWSVIRRNVVVGFKPRSSS